MPVTMIPENDPKDEGSSPSSTKAKESTTTSAEKPKEASVAVRLVALAQKAYDFRVDTSGKPFALRKGHHVAIPLTGGKRSLRKELGGYFYEISKKVASQTALTEAMEVLGHIAEKSGDPVELYLRSANVDDVIYIDIGDKTERVIKVSAEGWKILGARAEIPVLFRRTNVTSALPTPTRGGDLDQIWDFVNLDSDKDRELIKGWLAAAIILIGNPCPILGALGEQGAAKTSSARRIFSLFDPSEAAVRRPPNDADRLMHATAHSRSVVFDNLSSIPRWMSDGLCRAVTGESDVDRALYTDDDARIIRVQGVIGFTAIDVGVLAGDLAERCVWGNLRVIPKTERRSERDLNAAWDEAYSSMVGGLLDLVVEVLEALPMVDLEELPRMADFAEVLAAMDLATGSASLEHYTEAQESVATDIVDTDSFLVELTSKIRARWSGVGKELYALLQRPEKEKYWPEPRGMAGKLRRVAPDLRKAGWTVEEIESHLKGKAKTWVLVPPTSNGVSNAELLEANLLIEMCDKDRAEWVALMYKDGATAECAEQHAGHAIAGAHILCEKPGCAITPAALHPARTERSKVLEDAMLRGLNKVGLLRREVEQMIVDRGLAID